MHKTGSDYKADFEHRVWAAGIRDKQFIARSLGRHDVEGVLRSADSAALPGRYEEELDNLVDAAVKDYAFYRSERHESSNENSEQQHVRLVRRRLPRTNGGVANPWERQNALAQYLAVVASGNRGIRDFRSNILSGRLLSDKEALIFLSSPLAAHIPRSPLKSARAKTLGKLLDTSYELEEGHDKRGHYKKLVKGRFCHTLRPLSLTPNPIFPGDKVTPRELRWASWEPDAVVFPHPREERYVVAARKSILSYAVSLVEDSMRSYPISQEMGVWFVLTGEFVPEDPVHIHATTTRRPELHRTTITLEVEAWLPPEEVLEQYRHAQTEVLGKKPRSLKRQVLDVSNFVNRQSEKTWRSLLYAWNEANPPRSFRDPRHMYQAYSRTVENIAGVKTVRNEKTGV